MAALAESPSIVPPALAQRRDERRAVEVRIPRGDLAILHAPAEHPFGAGGLAGRATAAAVDAERVNLVAVLDVLLRLEAHGFHRRVELPEVLRRAFGAAVIAAPGQRLRLAPGSAGRYMIHDERD